MQALKKDGVPRGAILVVLMRNLAVGNTYTIIIYVQGASSKEVKSVKKVLKKKWNQCKQ